MVQLPRIAVGTVQRGVSTRPIVEALAEVLRRLGVRVQGFLSRAHFPVESQLGAVQPSLRHLDSWLMSPKACRALFAYGTRAADLAIVEGQFRPLADEGGGGQLEPLCQWLDLPRIVVLDVTRLQDCRLPTIPHHAAGLILDGVLDAHHLAGLTTNLESLFGVPVLGALRKGNASRDATPRVFGGPGTASAIDHDLGDSFARWWRAGKILELATRREMIAPDTSWLCRPRCCRRQLTVSIAYDEAFHCYFPDMLDLLELYGAAVIGFSPLRDEHLPPQTDVVVFGCGHPERYAATLSENHCLISALRSHVCAGRRIYGEGGGAAYLCRQIETPGGECKRMAGIVPAVARLLRRPVRPKPVEVDFDSSTWLGSAGTRVRGYRNSHWELTTLSHSQSTVSATARHPSLMGDFQAICSLVHLDFAADRSCLNHLFQPECADWTQPSASATSSR